LKTSDKAAAEQVKAPPPEAVALFLRPRRCAITG